MCGKPALKIIFLAVQLLPLCWPPISDHCYSRYIYIYIFASTEKVYILLGYNLYGYMYVTKKTKETGVLFRILQKTCVKNYKS